MKELVLFIQGFFGAPAVLIGLFALFGSLLLRKKATEVILSTLKAAIGYLVLSGGITILASTLDDFTIAFNTLFGLTGVMPNSDALAAKIMEAIPNVATMASLIMFIAICLNILLAKFSRFKYIFLTGHHALFISVLMATFFYFAGLNFSTDVWFYLIVGSAIVALYMLLSPALSHPFMEELTAGKQVYIGHANALGFAVAGWVGVLVGKAQKGKVKSTEDIRFPKWLSIFSKSAVSVATTMIIIFGVTYISYWAVRGKADMVSAGIITDSESVIVKIILDALIFTAGIEVLVFGIGMMLAELIPALEGISQKLIPGAKMAVDCSVALKYSPTAVLIGFVFSFIGGIIGLVATIGLHLASPAIISAVVIPGVIAHFFTGGVSGTFGNVKGGIIGAILGAFINGLILTVVPLIYITMQSTYGWGPFDPNGGTLQWAESDYALLSVIGWLMKLVWSKWMILALVIIVFIALFTDGYFWNKQHKATLTTTTSAVEVIETQDVIKSEAEVMQHAEQSASDSTTVSSKKTSKTKKPKEVKVKMKKIVVTGSIGVDHVFLVDKLPNKGQSIISKSFSVFCGGKGANQAVALAKLGATVEMIGKVGADESGLISINNLKHNGVDPQYVEKDIHHTTQVANIIVDEHGDNLLIVDPGANFAFKASEIDKYKHVIDAADIALTQLETTYEFIEEFVTYAHAQHKLVVLNPGPPLRLSKNILQKCDFVIPNETELCILLDKEYTEDLATLKQYAFELQTIANKHVIVTLGENGSLWINPDKQLKQFKAWKVKPVDATAAGDTFIGAFISYLAQDKSIEDSINFASAAAALTVTKLGAQDSLPSLAEVNAFIKNYH